MGGFVNRLPNDCQTTARQLPTPVGIPIARALVTHCAPAIPCATATAAAAAAAAVADRRVPAGVLLHEPFIIAASAGFHPPLEPAPGRAVKRSVARDVARDSN